MVKLPSGAKGLRPTTARLYERYSGDILDEVMSIPLLSRISEGLRKGIGHTAVLIFSLAIMVMTLPLAVIVATASTLERQWQRSRGNGQSNSHR